MIFPQEFANILGIRTGMTLSKVEAAAENNYKTNPRKFKGYYGYPYKEVIARSPEYVWGLQYLNDKKNTSDDISLYFTGPATGNLLWGMGRTLSFNVKAVANLPPISAVQASLFKKYGKPTYKNVQPDMGYYLYRWTYSEKSRFECGGNCEIGPNFYLTSSPQIGKGLSAAAISEFFFNSSSLDEAQLEIKCGGVTAAVNGVTNSLNVLRIYASITPDGTDNSKAQGLQISIWNSPLCRSDTISSEKQLKSAAITYYNKISKSGAAPKL